VAVPVEVEGDNVQPILTVGPVMGIDATTAPFRLAPDNIVDATNVTPNDTFGSYVTALGRSEIGTLPGPINGFTKFIRPGFADTYIFAVDFGGVGNLYQGPLLGPYTPLALPEVLTPGLNTQFVFSLKWCFVNNSVDRPLKIDLNLVVTFWGIEAPSDFMSLTSGPPGNLNGTYYYCITFGNVNQESSQGVVSGPITVVNQQILLSLIPISTDPQVTQRNIYRLSLGALNQFYLIHTINDNVTTTYTDNLADANVTGQLLTVNRDLPFPFDFICTHQERIWGWGTPTDPSLVYYSNLNEPWGFNLVTGFLPVGENSFNDAANGMTSQGGVLLLNKDRSLYAVYGSTNADFIAIKISDTGCRSGLSVATLDGMSGWINKRGVWFCDGTTPQNMSDGQYQVSNIKKFITTLLDVDLDTAVGFWYDRMYHISFPRLNLTYFFDLRSKSWWKLGWATDHVFTDAEADQNVLGNNLQHIGQFDQWFTGGSDLGDPIMSSILTRITDAGDSSSDKIYRYGEVVAPPQVGFAYLTCIANPGNQQYVDLVTFDLNNSFNGVRHQESWSRPMRGSEVQMLLQTLSFDQLEVQQATIYGFIDRKLIQVSGTI
jgi:hypothetical protein